MVSQSVLGFEIGSSVQHVDRPIGPCREFETTAHYGAKYEVCMRYPAYASAFPRAQYAPKS